MTLRLLAILGASLAFTAAIVALVLWVLISGDKAAREGATQFAAALVGGAAPPEGTDKYADGVRAHFGDVASARVINTRNHRVGSGDRARTFHLSDVLLQTAKGPAVIELKFDGVGPLSRDITDVYEIAPRDVPDDALTDGEIVALAKAFDRRGGHPVRNVTLVRVSTPDKVVRPKKQRKARTPVATPPPILACVQQAKGDVEKLAACAN